ncbi:MAG TPA: hypothetical protein VNA69_14495 [Thermoanaerobaculia bacterium]|nr:hypothetical protein [Thermoanaerobaculia bacterium]
MNDGEFSKKLHSLVTAAFVLTIALGSQTLAQTTEVRLTLADQTLCTRLTSPGASDPDRNCRFRIWVAYDEQDQALPACWKEKCDWIASVDGALLDATVFSLRIPGAGRTPCRSGKAVDAWHMDVTFTGSGGETTRDLKIVRGNADVSVDSRPGYVREVGPSPAGDVRCHEEGLVPATLSNVQLDIENVRLQVFPAQTVKCAVIVDHLLPRADAREATEIGPKELANAIRRYDIEGKHCYAPTVTVVEPLETRLRTLTRSFRVTVEK